MESTAINLHEEKTGSEKEAVKTGQDGKAEEVELVTGEMKQLDSQVNQFICGGRAGALGILPEELWLILLEEVVDSAEDIQSVLLAFPQLDQLFQSQKTSWLFALVLPHLMTKYLVAEMSEEDWNRTRTWIRSEELLKLRLVSKRWKKAVDRSLQNHAGRHPLVPRDKNTKVEQRMVAVAVVAIPENHFSYHRIRKYLPGPTRFRKAEIIDKFLQEMGKFQGNPFPSKSVFLRLIGRDSPQAMRRAVLLFEKFGQHVVNLEIEHLTVEHFRAFGEEDVGGLELYRNILRCLSLVPNLRSLIFSGKFFGARDPERDNFFGNPENQSLFPELRNLKIFEWRVAFQERSIWVTRMLENYGWREGLQKLAIPLNLHSTVDLSSYQSIHLTELHLFLDDDFDQDLDRIERVVRTLPNHQEIRKFRLSSLEPSGRLKVWINELIVMLTEFKFESVLFQDLDLSDGMPIPKAVVPAATVTSLDLEEEGDLRLSYDFMRELPNLRYLSVKIGSRGRRQILKEYWRMMREDRGVDLEVGSLGKRLTRYYMKAYDSTLEIPENEGIWKEVPSLEMLSLSMPVMTGVGKEMEYLGVKFVRECGNQAFFGPRADVVKWEKETRTLVADKSWREWKSKWVNPK